MGIFTKVAHWVRRLTTTHDNQTPDVVRILGVLMGIQFLVNAGYALAVEKQAWDPSAYGTGAGLILAAIGAALGLKKWAEPS